jgi:hypothetical protein
LNIDPNATNGLPPDNISKALVGKRVNSWIQKSKSRFSGLQTSIVNQGNYTGNDRRRCGSSSTDAEVPTLNNNVTVL